MNKYLNQSSKQYFAFNIWSIESAKAVIDGCANYGNDALLQTSMKAYGKLDKKELRQFVTSYSVKRGIKGYLHLDHCKEMSAIKEAIDFGWDSVMIDASDRPLYQNIEQTNHVVDYAHERGVLVESEIGQINGETGVASYEDVCLFAEQTDVDLLAVAIGTAHGLYHGTPILDFDLLERVIGSVQTPLVIHGGTGLEDDVFLKLLRYEQVKKINISTDVKMSYREAIRKAMEDELFQIEGFDPLKVVEYIQTEIRTMVEYKQELLKRGIVHE